ncbi:MAG TPA: DPP IV N-terminal domain-containing protein [Polyangiaceae bacterium]|jgi:dipeptidyl aminopeptidase/acylaminoacyl peptidase
MNRDPLSIRAWFAFAVLTVSASGCRAPAPAARAPLATPAPPAAVVATPKPPAFAAREVFPHHVTAHWLQDHAHFFYRNEQPDGVREYLLVDATTGERTPLFDQTRLAAALSQASGKEVKPDHLALHRLELDEKRTTMIFSAAEKRWRCDLQTYALQRETEKREVDSLRLAAEPTTRTGPATELTFVNDSRGAVAVYWMDFEGHRKRYATLPPGSRHTQPTYAGHVWVLTDAADRVLMAFETPEDGGEYVVDQEDTPLGNVPVAVKTAAAAKAPPVMAPADEPRGIASPDGHRLAFVKDHNVYLRDARTRTAVALSHDGTADDSYAEGDLAWSPDSTRIVAMRTKKGDTRKVYLVESSPHDQLQPKLDSYDYLKPGDRIPVQKPHLFDVTARASIPLSDSLYPQPWSISEVRWSSDSKHFSFLYNQRGHQMLRVVSVDARSGEARAIVDEQSKTFIDYSGKLLYRRLDDTHEILWMSERDGYNHLYLYDADTGAVKNQITRGEWVVRSVESVDEKQRQIWFFAGGVRPGQDPYYLHLCRVGFDGTGFTVLTEGDGTHLVELSPDRRFFIDTWSRVDQPPVTELRRASDGKLVRELERADDRRLLETGWTMPERFVAKGRDGQTDIYGILIRPSSFDPTKTYPVIEDIYAGPTGAFVPKAFGLEEDQHALADRGFIVVQIDGMGTSYRSRAFHDVAWKNLADSGFPDRIAWMKAAAAKHPEMDLTRVGIYGGSAGGQSALRALLSHGDFYKAAVADSGCHDNRMDKIWWNEQWMGWPVDDSYVKSSNVVDAHNLTGKLLLIEGELDHNVDPSSTMQVVDALIKANKDFELLVVPGGGHGVGDSPYGRRRRADFFVRSLIESKP